MSVKSRRSGRGRTGSVSLAPTPAKLSVSTQTLLASEADISSPMATTVPLKQTTGYDNSSHRLSVVEADGSESVTSPALTRGTVEVLLSQLTEMHDRQQDVQRVEWDAFLKRRRRAVGGSTINATSNPALTFLSSSSAIPSSAAAMLGLSRYPAEGDDEDEISSFSKGLVGVAQLGFGTKNKEDWREFNRLVRAGIPLTYRAKLWSECCGAIEATEPGVFQDLLLNHKAVENTTISDIEKDVKRTSEDCGDWIYQLATSD